jgi:hypothetical protein
VFFLELNVYIHEDVPGVIFVICGVTPEQYFVVNITVYGIMCLFTILMLNVCGVAQSLW